jgi:Lar family restriction alleviation protein
MSTTPNTPDGTKGEEKLLPCPFCGSSVVQVFSDAGWWRVGCCECNLRFSGRYGLNSKDEAIAAWNRRSPAPTLPSNETMGKVGEPRKRIEGCKHPMARMIDYINEAACPICLLATVIEKDERLKLAEGLLDRAHKDLANFDEYFNSALGKEIDAFLARNSPPDNAGGKDGR